MRHLIITLSALLFTTPTLFAEEIDIYLLGGQSNMRGVGLLPDLTEAERQAPAGVSFWTGEEFVALIPGKVITSVEPLEFGPELGLAHAIASPQRRSGIVKHALGGMPLHPGWNGQTWVGGEPAPGRVTYYPGTSSDDPAMGTLYIAMRKRFREAIAAVHANGETPRIVGFVWMQGEQDAKHEVSASSYAKYLRLLRDRLASDLNLSELPMVYGQVLPHNPPHPKYVYRDIVRREMAAADHRSGKAESIPLAQMVSTDKFPLKADTVHYNARGQWQLGLAFAHALSQLSATTNVK
ncbi:MAG: hypothetical protein KDA90_10635 [Planctomycetaceae bacterium]|nr:hypothetical protein [Planctomycetaceae bacterium]